MKRKFIVTAILSFCLINCNSDNSPWIWKIAGQKYTVNNFEDAYDNFITLTAQQMQMKPEELKEYIKHPEKSGLPAENMQMLRGFSKDAFPEQYKRMILVNTEAEKVGFTKKKEIQSRLKFIQQFYIANLYMAEKVKTDETEVSDEEAYKAWKAFSASNPQAMGVPLDQGMKIAKQRLAMKKAYEKQQEMYNDIVESYTIETNPDFKIKEYLKKEEDKKDKADSSDSKPDTNKEEKSGK